jgi:chromosome segregation ATPase
LESQSKTLNKDKEGIQNQISDLKESLTPIDTKLDIKALGVSKSTIESKIQTNETDKESKRSKINEYGELLGEVSQSINQHAVVNGMDIDDAKKEWDLAKGKIADIQTQIDKLESQYEANCEKLSHLAEHEYDPNCKFCMNNVFVKDAIATKEIVKTQESQLETLNLSHQMLIKATEPYSEVDDVWSKLVELRNKYHKGIVVREKAEAELGTLETQNQLLQNQLESVQSDINKYYENEATIQKNAEIRKNWIKKLVR